MENYKYKYLKYKYKYLQLQLGGLRPGNKRNRNSWVDSCGIVQYNPKPADYFKNVNINVKVKKHLWLMLFLKIGTVNADFNYVKKEIFNELKELNKNLKTESWIKCKDKCLKKLKGFLDAEVTSTAYILRCLVSSIIQPKESNIKLKIKINIDIKNLTGTWDNDKQYIKIEQLEKNKKPRLIMGFGPSASGKTFWAESIIKILSSTDRSFPNAFLSIDGGIYREKSVVYQLIIKLTKKLCNKKILGFENLYSSGLANIKGRMKSLFKSPKSKIRDYLKTNSKTVKLSLYVPETAGSCLQCRVVIKKCACAEKIVAKYKKITGDDKWIGLFIWQCLKGSDCRFPDDSKCRSTSASGKSRELDEGKKFSPAAYKFSFNGGLATMKRAPGGRIEIHNGGGLKFRGKFTKSTIKEYPLDKKGKKLLDKIDFTKINSIYVHDKYDMHH